MKTKTLFLLALIGFSQIGSAQTARIQAIHNSADISVDTVDVWLNSTPTGAIKLVPNFVFRTATSFINAPAGTPITLAIAPKNSAAITDTITGLNFTFNLAEDSTYVIVADGIFSGSGYNPGNGVAPFDLKVYGSGREEAVGSGNTDVLVHHGSTDAPMVDVDERSGLGLVNDAVYGDFAGYLSLSTADYILDVKDATGSVVVASYVAPLASLGLTDSAITVVASGFLDSTVNNNGPSFGLWVALPEGGSLIPLPVAPGPKARIQVIHNCADVLADSVDIYLGNTLLLPDVKFRTATPFLDIDALTPLQIGIAPGNSLSVADTIPGAVFNFNLSTDSTYVIVADGIVSGSGYNPGNGVAPFDLKVYGSGREQAITSGTTDVLVHHGSTDAPIVDVDERGLGNFVNDAAYGDFSGYTSLTTADYILDVKNALGTTTLFSYAAPLSTLGLDDSAIVVVASGFVDSTMNNNGPSFGLWVALASGGALIPLPETGTTSLKAVEGNNIKIYPNPALNELFIDGAENLANASIINIDGKVVASYQVSTSLRSLDVSNIAKGSYQIVFTQSNGSLIKIMSFVKL